MPHQTAIRNLSIAHRNMERVLTLLRLQADSLRDGDDSTQLTLLGNSVVYMRNYPGVNHHPTEDLILDKLKGFARSLCDALTGQHRGFQHQEDELLRSIRDVQGGNNAACQRVRELAAVYCADNFSHIHDEEDQLFPLAVRRLSAEDWHEVDARSKAMTDSDVELNELKSYDNLYERLMSLNKQAAAF